MSGARADMLGARPTAATLALKRALDLSVSVLGLVLLAPAFLIIAIVIKVDSPGPALFRQERVGSGGRLFRILKFRSMVAAASSRGVALTTRDDNRITRVGAFLRRSKLDELPQLFNVLVGDMSLVGPRPEVPAFIEFYTRAQRAVMLSVRPGITDYAAILYRDESSLLDGQNDLVELYRLDIMPRKFACYERYARGVSLVADLRIIVATLAVLVLGRVPRSLGIEDKIGP